MAWNSTATMGDFEAMVLRLWVLAILERSLVDMVVSLFHSRMFV